MAENEDNSIIILEPKSQKAKLELEDDENLSQNMTRQATIEPKSQSNFFHYKNEAIDTSVYTLKHPFTSTLGADLLLRTPDNMLIPVHQDFIKSSVPYFKAALNLESCWRDLESIGGTKVIDTPTSPKIPGDVVVFYVEFKYSSFSMKVPKEKKPDPDFDLENVFDLLKLSSYWLDDEFKQQAVKFISRELLINQSTDMCKTFISRLFESGFNDPVLKPILQTYVSRLEVYRSEPKSGTQPKCKECFKLDFKAPSLFEAVCRAHPECVNYLAQENKELVNKRIFEMNAGVQSEVLALFWKESLASELIINEEFIDEYGQNFPHYSPLDLAIQCQSGWQITKILIENGAQVDYVNPISRDTALIQAFEMYAFYIRHKESRRFLRPEQRLLPGKTEWMVEFFDENGHKPTGTIELLLEYRATLPEEASDDENTYLNLSLPEDFFALKTSHPEAYKTVNDLISKEIKIKFTEADEVKDKFETIKEIFMNNNV